jgi:hypothetical protein
MRSTSRIDAAELIDHVADRAIHTPNATMSEANAARSRPGALAPSTIRRIEVGTRNASATQPQDCEK